MKVTINPKVFADAVTAAGVAVPSRPAVPILGAILIDPSDTGLLFAGYDYDQSSRITVPAEVDTAQRVGVSGKLLAQVAKVLPQRRDVELTIEGGGSRFVVSSGTTQFTLPTMAADDFPELPNPTVTLGEVNVAAFVDAVHRVSHAAERGDGTAAKTALASVQVRLGGAGTLVLTGASHYQLATIEMPWIPAAGNDVEMLVPAEGLIDMTRALTGTTATVTTNDGATILGLSSGGYAATSSTFDMAEFPKWERLFPDQYTTVVAAETEVLIESLRRAKAVAEKTPFVNIEFDDESAELLIDDTIRDEFPVVTTGTTGLIYRVNVGLLLDSVLTINDDSTTIAFATNRMAVLRPGADLNVDDAAPVNGYRALVMGGTQTGSAS